jgi:hypothetical protein
MFSGLGQKTVPRSAVLAVPWKMASLFIAIDRAKEIPRTEQIYQAI